MIGTRLRSIRADLLYRRILRLAYGGWKQRHKKVLALHPAYAKPCPPGIEKEHVQLWSRLNPDVRLETLRICANISGRADIRFVPEEIFAANIERCLSDPSWAPLLAHKSLYAKFLPKHLFPPTPLHSIDGELYDSDLRPLTPQQAAEILPALQYPVVIKPNVDSGGGKGVAFPASAGELRVEMEARRDYVVQEKSAQHPLLAAFNAHGLNTLRLYTYKSVTDRRIHVLNVTLRLGRGGSLDNETAGGIVCSVAPDGALNTYAVDKYGTRFDSHPDTGLRFGPGFVLPNFPALLALAADMAAGIPYLAVIGWDFYLREDGTWGCIELNTASHTIRFAQYAGQPFFGEFTDEVIAYCERHPRLRRASMRIY